MARYLRLRDLQREIEEGLNVMESSNGANSVIGAGYAKSTLVEDGETAAHSQHAKTRPWR